MKTQSSVEGVGDGVDSDADAEMDGGWMWNLRTPTLSTRYRSRADIHFCTLYVLYEGVEIGPEEILRHHFHIRQPSAAESSLPSVWLQCLQMTAAADCASLGRTYKMSASG